MVTAVRRAPTAFRCGVLGLAALSLMVVQPPAAPAQATHSCLEYQNYLRLLCATFPGTHSPNDVYGYIDMVLVDGMIWACEMDYGLRVLDASDPRRLREVAELELPESPNGITRMGEYAVVAGGSIYGPPNGLRIVDLSQPSAPAIVGGVPLTWRVNAVAVAGTLAYLACDGSPGGLLLFDLSVPQSPALIGQLAIAPFGAMDVAIAGTTAVLACRDSLRSVDVSDPAAPRQTASVSLPWPGAWPARRLALQGSRAYVTGSAAGINDGGLVILDLSGATPTVIGTVPLGARAVEVALAGNLVCVGEQRSIMTLIDVTDPGNPALLSRVKVDATWAQSIVCDGTTVIVGTVCDYTAGDLPGFYVVDITNPQPAPMAATIPDTSLIEVLAAEGNTLVSAGYNSFEVFDVSDPVLPVRQARIALPGLAQALDVEDGLACVVGWTFPNRIWLQVVDITTPTAPVLRGELILAIRGDVKMRGRHAYVCDNHGVTSVDLSDPDAPSVVGSLGLGAGAAYPEVAGDLLYARSSDLLVIDVLDPATPTLIATIPLPGDGLAINGRYAYTSSAVIDMTNPLVPQIVGMFPDVLPCRDIVAHGNTLYIIGNRAQVVDVSLPSAPLLVGSILAGTDPLLAFYPRTGTALGHGLAPGAEAGPITLAWWQCDAPVGVPLPRGPAGPLSVAAVPNPFNPRTTIRFDVSVGGRVQLAVYDVAGRLVRVLVEEDLPAGSHQAVWDGRDAAGRAIASGSYFARLEAGGAIESRRLSLVR